MSCLAACASAAAWAARRPRGWRGPRAGGPAGSPCRARPAPGPARRLVIHVHEQPLDDAVGLRLDLDLGDRLHLAGGHDGADHRSAFDRRQAGRVEVGRRTVGGRDPVGRRSEHSQRDRTNRPFAGLRHDMRVYEPAGTAVPVPGFSGCRVPPLPVIHVDSSLPGACVCLSADARRGPHHRSRHRGAVRGRGAARLAPALPPHLLQRRLS